MTSLSESCDASNITCLIGQTLVEEGDGLRFCVTSSLLSPFGENCTRFGEIYCRVLDECINFSSSNASSSSSSSSSPCNHCPPSFLLCLDSRTCVSSLAQCCGLNAYYCNILERCLGNDEVCRLPNIAPVVAAPLIHVDSVSNFDLESAGSGDGHVIGWLLSNNLTHPAVDAQGEELSVAIIEISDILELEGAWQYGMCPNTSWSLCRVEEWVGIGTVSESNALVLPSLARIRFVQFITEKVEGAVWVRVKLWDGNRDGYLSESTDLVRSVQPHYASTLSFSPSGAFSENTTLLSLLLLPTLPPPLLTPHTLTPSQPSVHFANIQEDVSIVGNRGNVIEALVGVSVPDLPILPEDEIEGFPDIPVSDSGLTGSYDDLLPIGVRNEYLSRVKGVNPTRLERQIATEHGQSAGVGINLSADVIAGWQVAWNGDVRKFVFLESLTTSSATNQILLLNTSARVRFVPGRDYCGSVSILLHAWDGYWNETESTRLAGGFLVTNQTALSAYNLNNQSNVATQLVECTPDKPVIQVSPVQLQPAPYYLSYEYERLFTLIVSAETEYVRAERERLSELLQVILEVEIELLRIASVDNER